MATEHTDKKSVHDLPPLPAEIVEPSKKGSSLGAFRTGFMVFLSLLFLAWTSNNAFTHYGKEEGATQISDSTGAGNRLTPAITSEPMQKSCDGCDCKDMTIGADKVLIAGSMLQGMRFCHTNDSLIMYLSSGEFIFGPKTEMPPTTEEDMRNGIYVRSFDGQPTIARVCECDK